MTLPFLISNKYISHKTYIFIFLKDRQATFSLRKKKRVG
jgi:hypothetical protein